VPVEVMESPQWCRLPINARRILEHLLVVNVRLGREKTASFASVTANFRSVA
jgi:hypothetical protein